MNKHPSRSVPQIPKPAHPHRRNEPLPWHRPKPIEDDPNALKRVEAILGNPNYLTADHDAKFLERDGVRGVRLQLDYLKAELLLRDHNVKHTIVVFGSTRICEPARAQRTANTLRAALASSPNDPDISRRLAIAENIVAKSHYYETARTFGRMTRYPEGAAPDGLASEAASELCTSRRQTARNALSFRSDDYLSTSVP